MQLGVVWSLSPQSGSEGPTTSISRTAPHSAGHHRSHLLRSCSQQNTQVLPRFPRRVRVHRGRQRILPRLLLVLQQRAPAFRDRDAHPRVGARRLLGGRRGPSRRHPAGRIPGAPRTVPPATPATRDACPGMDQQTTRITSEHGKQPDVSFDLTDTAPRSTPFSSPRPSRRRDDSSSTPGASSVPTPTRRPPRSTITTTNSPQSSPHPSPSAPPGTPASASPIPASTPTRPASTGRTDLRADDDDTATTGNISQAKRLALTDLVVTWSSTPLSQSSRK
jgi:hypothetical protein